MLAETTVQNLIRGQAAALGDDLWRNNTGVLRNPETGQPVRYGLLNDSARINKVIKSSDLIGATKVLVTPDMIGRVLAVFTAIEVKEENWFYSGTDREVAQKAFIDLVLRAGGFAGFARSVADYRRIVNK